MKRLFLMVFALVVGSAGVTYAAASLLTSSVLTVNKVLLFAPTTIAISTTTSAAIATGGLSLVGVQLPAAFTGTTLTFQISFDGVTYQPVYTSTSGTALSYTVAAGHYVAVNPQDFYGANYIKLISGSSEAAARTFSVALKGL